MDSTIEITVNGESRVIDTPATVTAMLQHFGLLDRMVVVEHNGRIVRREAYGDTPIAAGDTFEIVQMMAGG